MMYRALLDHPSIAERDFSSLRRALYAMAPMPQQTLVRCLEVFDCGFYLLFGQTEMSPTTTIFRPENQLSHPGAAGTPVVNVHVAIMGEDGTLLPQGETGENVSSIEVERAIYAAEPGVADAVVVGLPHPHWSEALTAFVTARDGAALSADQIRQNMRQHIDAYKIPKAVVVIDSVPRTSTGKIQKNLIRDAYATYYDENASSD